MDEGEPRKKRKPYECAFCKSANVIPLKDKYRRRYIHCFDCGRDTFLMINESETKEQRKYG